MTAHRIARLALRAAVPLAAFSLLLAPAVGHAITPPHHPRFGTITGVLELAGGPAPGKIWPVPGVVTAHRHGIENIVTRAGKHGRFRIRQVAPGRYRLTGHPRHQHLICRAPHKITVRPGKTVHVKVVCPVP